MGYGLYPFIPVLVHEVGDDTSRSLGEVGVNVFCCLAELNLLDVS